LAPLDRAQVQEMVAELSARHALPRDVVEDVAARTGGVPLFVEEVTRLLLERGEGGGGIRDIPATLQQSLMARLDRLGPSREVAQIGSVIGRGFSYGLLRDVAGMEDAALQAALEKLAEADIVLVQGLPPESDYRFKHALIQDAAYENLLKSRRQVLHRRVAEILRDRFADTARAGSACLSLYAGGHDECRDRMVGQGRRPGLAPFRLPGSDIASRQGHRNGGQTGTSGSGGGAATGRPSAVADCLRQRTACGARAWRARDDGCLHPRRRARRRGGRYGRAFFGALRPLDRQLCSG